MGTTQWQIFTSLDGVADADDDWQYPFFDEELFEWVAAAWRRASVVLLGRRTFEGYEAVREGYPTSPVVGFLDSVPNHVVTSTALKAPRGNVSVISGEVTRHIGALRAETDGTVLVLGSPTLSRWLIANQLLDGIDLMVLPVLVGRGTRLFDEHDPSSARLHLRQTRALVNGAVHLDYDLRHSQQ